MTEIQQLIKAANKRLEKAEFSVAIRQRGKKLVLIATLPPKPDSGRVDPFQQTISLGLPANHLGAHQAEAEANRLGSQLITGDFSWAQYTRARTARQPLSTLIKRFERMHRSKNKISDETWQNHYLYYYRRLPQDKPLSTKAIMPLIFAKKEHTRARKQVCRQFQKLCDFAGIEVDLLQYQGTYNSSSSVERDIPLDEDIAAGFHKIGNPRWQWVYGMMATFGLRDHEVWLCHFVEDEESEDVQLQVTDGKTGPRLIGLPLYPEWVETFDLLNVKRPDLRLDKGWHYLSQQSGQAFRRQQVGFPPYTLRYAYGHRGTVNFGYEPPVMAQQMGHSLDVHLKTYQRFLNEKLLKRKVAEMKSRPGLPKAPTKN